jgi:hypothetical protein
MEPSKNRQRGKQVEKEVAKRMGGKRVGILGKSDVELEESFKNHPLYSIEVKSRLKAACISWMNQAIRNCREGKIPIVRLHIKGKKYEDDIVMITAKYFEKWFEK